MGEKELTLQHSAERCLLHRGLGRVELFDYPLDGMDMLREMYTEMKGSGYKGLSFHAPMPRPSYFPFAGITCFFLNDNTEHRELSFRLVEETLQHAQAWGADYIVTHLTYGKTDTSDPDRAFDLAQDACEKFAALSHRYEVPINIEFAAYTQAFNDPRLFIEVISQHQELGICIDTGHTMLGANMHERDYLNDIRTLAPHARSMHLWNTRGEDFTHIPLHPSQSPTEGWIDIEQTLETVLASNPEIAIVFEYPVKEVTPDIQAGYDWVEEMVARISERNL